MNISLEIILKNKLEKYERKYELFNDFDKLRLLLITNKKEKFKNIINNVPKIKEEIKELYNEIYGIDSNSDCYDLYSMYEKFMKLSDENILEVLNEIDTIIISGDLIEIKEYIENNIELRDKKIVLNQILNIDDDIIYEVIKTFKNNKNVYVKLEGNEEIITIDDLEKTMHILNNIINDVKQYKFSPLEEVMYLYDKIRDRKALEEDEYENKRISRDLTQVLLGDKIVCEGFSNIFNSVLKMLGYKTMKYIIVEKESNGKKRVGHCRNMLHLIDKKYNIDGVYEIDVTWGSKRHDNDLEYINYYKYFLKTRKDMENFKRKLYKDITFPFYTEDLITSFKKVVETKGIEHLPKDIANTINNISRFIDGETLISPIMLLKDKHSLPLELKTDLNIDYIIDRLIYYDNLFNSPINADVLIKALYNVRKIEYYKDPDKYPFDIKNIYKTAINSNWVFKSNMSSLLLAIYGCLISEKLIEDTRINLDKINKELDLERNIECVKLCKTLRNIYNVKNDK